MRFDTTLLTAAVLALGGFAAMSGANAKEATSTFEVQMKVESKCNVTTANNIGFQDIDASGSTSEVLGSTFNVACSNTTPYTISMLPSGADTSGIGSMKGTGVNKDTIAYQLTTDAEGNTVWTGGGDKQGGTGTGLDNNFSHTVYAKVNDSDFKAVTPDVYKETVTISVLY